MFPAAAPGRIASLPRPRGGSCYPFFMAFNRVAPVVVTLALIVAACGDTPGGAVVEALTEAVAPDRAPPINRAEAMALPYASALVTLGNRRPAFVVLHSSQGGRQIWLSADRVAIATEQGRVVALAGLAGAITETRFRDGQPPKPLAGGEHLRLVDIAPTFWGLTITCTNREDGEETIQILGAWVPTLRAVETCRTERGERFTERFWIGAEDGLIWRADQWIGPGLPRLTFELVKPPTSW